MFFAYRIYIAQAAVSGRVRLWSPIVGVYGPCDSRFTLLRVIIIWRASLQYQIGFIGHECGGVQSAGGLAPSAFIRPRS